MDNPLRNPEVVDIEMGSVISGIASTDAPSTKLRSLTYEINKQKRAMKKSEYTLRENLYNWVNSIGVQFFLVTCIFIDIIILIYEQTHPEEDFESTAIASTTLVVLLVFLAEVLVKLFVYGPYLFGTFPP